MTEKYGLLRSLTTSYEKPVNAKVTGDLPKWLSGTLFRNGPGRYEYGNKSYKHIFDGHSCVHKFRIENGNVYYSNKFLETKSYTKSLKENRLYMVFGTVDVCSNIFSRFKIFFFESETLDNVNINVVPFANEHLYALTETSMMCKIDPFDLTIKSTINIRDYIKKASTTIAHPHVDSNGSWLTMAMNIVGLTQYYEFIRYDATQKDVDLSNPCKVGKTIASIPSSHKSAGLSYFHSFGVTKNYIVFLEQSLFLDTKKFMKILIKNKALSDSLVMKPDWRTRIHVLRKDTGEILKQKYITEPILVFHHINAYEDTNNNIIVDVCAYDPNKFKLDELNCENMFSEKLVGTDLIKSTAKRIKIPIGFLNVKDEIYCEIQVLNNDVSIELPTINYSRFNGLPYKYVYGFNYERKPFSIVKINMDNPNEVLEMSYTENDRRFLPSEPIFVESPNPTSEDDGVVLVMVLADNNDFLSVLDAKTLKEIARAEIPEDVKGAFTLHGFFADSKTYAKLN